MVSAKVKLYNARKKLRIAFSKGKISVKEYREQRADLTKAIETENIKSTEKLATAPSQKVVGSGKQAAIKTLQQKQQTQRTQTSQIVGFQDQYGNVYKGKEVNGQFIGTRTVSKREQQRKANIRAGFYSIGQPTNEKTKAKIIAEQTAIRGAVGIYSPFPLTEDVKFSFTREKQQKEAVTYDNLPEFSLKGREKRVKELIKFEKNSTKFKEKISSLASKPTYIEGYKPAKLNLVKFAYEKIEFPLKTIGRVGIALEGLGIKEGRRELFKDAPKRVFPAIKQSYNPKTPEGLANIVLTGVGVQQVRTYLVSKPYPVVKEIDVSSGGGGGSSQPNVFGNRPVVPQSKGVSGGGADIGNVGFKQPFSDLGKLVGRGSYKNQKFAQAQETVLLQKTTTITKEISITVQYPKLETRLLPVISLKQEQAQQGKLKIAQDVRIKQKSLTETAIKTEYKAITEQKSSLLPRQKTRSLQKQVQIPIQIQAQQQTQAQAQKQIQVQKLSLKAVTLQKQVLKQDLIKLPKFSFKFRKKERLTKSLISSPIRQPKDFFPSLRSSFLGLKGESLDSGTGLDERFLKKKRRV